MEATIGVTILIIQVILMGWFLKKAKHPKENNDKLYYNAYKKTWKEEA